MDRTRASSLESHRHLCGKFDSLNSMNSNCFGQRSRLHSLATNPAEFSDDSDYYYQCKRPPIANADLQSQFDVLQCTVNRMLNGGVFDEMGSTVPSADLSDALKHEYHQMMSALKELENILGCKSRTGDVNFSATPCINDSEILQLQREIYFRDSLIKCLSDRLKVLCKANDKLIIDYENQENILSDELICLKLQLEKAKDALRSLSSIKKSRSNMAMAHDIETESYYLKESLRTKEAMISDLKYRLEKVGIENSDLKCELESRNVSNCQYGEANALDRELSYSHRKNEQLQTEIESLKTKLQCKCELIDDLQRKLNCGVIGLQEHTVIDQLREELMLAHEENEMTKEAILEQSDMIEDFKNQIKILSENNCFKDDTISELRCCIRKLSECQQGPSVHVSRHRSTDERGSQSVDHLQANTLSNAVEQFKEFLTNTINIKNTVLKFLTTNVIDDLDVLSKLKTQMATILSTDMDTAFRTGLKDYLHQCLLLDDSLRTVIEHFVKSLNNVTSKNKFLTSENINMSERLATYVPDKMIEKRSFETPSRMANTMRESVVKSEINRIHQLEEELQAVNSACQQERLRFNADMEANIRKLEALNKKIAELQRLLDGKSSAEADYKRLSAEYQDILQQSKKCLLDNDRLKGELELMAAKNQQLERNLSLKNAELENLEKSVRHVSDQFANLSFTQDNVKKSIESIKDAEIERLNREIGELKLTKNQLYELKQTNSEQARRIESLEAQGHDTKKRIANLQSELDRCDAEKQDLLHSISLLQDEKKRRASREPQLNDELAEMTEMIEKLKRENFQAAQQTQTNISNLKAENQSLLSDKEHLENQVKQLKSRISELNRCCEETHVNKQAMKSETEQAQICKQKVVDLESVLACLTDELNEKVQMIENLRRSARSDPPKLFSKDNQRVSIVDPDHHLLLQKESEIAFLKSRINALEADKGSRILQEEKHSPLKSAASETIAELQRQINLLNLQLTERSENIAHLQQLLNEKDGIIENSNRIIQAKGQSMGETDKMLHLMSLENRNLKDELATKLHDEGQLKLLRSTVSNLSEEIAALRTENDRLRSEIIKLTAERDNLKRYKPQSILPHSSSQSILPDSSVQQINNEIHKLYVDFEGKSNEIKEYSLKEINNRDRKIEDLNLELKLKSDQFSTIVVENRRLQDRIEDDSQRSSRYEQNLLLKEQLVAKLMREKEKIRATFITELQNKNEELNHKSKTVYFLNAELHRLASELEIKKSDLRVVKMSDKFVARSKNTLEISQANFDSVTTENNSLKLCINLKMSELEAARNELTVRQLNEKSLQKEIKLLTSKSNESLRNESDLQRTIKMLKEQLAEIKDEYKNMKSAAADLEQENLTLKQVKEKVDKEKNVLDDEVICLKLKIEMLDKSLMDCRNKISRKSTKFENEKEEVRRLSDILEINKQSILNQQTSLDQALQENAKYKSQLEAHAERLRLKDSELMKYKQVESQLDRKNNDCEQLKCDYKDLLKQYEDCQQKFEDLKFQEQKKYRMLEQKSYQCNHIQDNLALVKSQLCATEDKLKTCNSQWLDKYGQLKSTFDQMEFDCHKMTDENAQLIRENDRLCCEKNCLQNSNSKSQCQVESLSGQLLAAHTEICELTVQLHESQSKINDFSSKLKQDLVSIRHYGSHPVLNQITDQCGFEHSNFEQKDYCDLKTRYSALCNHIDNLINQLKKKDKRIQELQCEYDRMSHSLTNYEQVQCDYHDLDYKYGQLRDDFDSLSQYYQNLNYSRHQHQQQAQEQSLSVIQVCADELQDTINCQNRQIDELRLTKEALCNRVKQLEEQIHLDNIELEKCHQDFCGSERKYEDLRYAYEESLTRFGRFPELQQDNTDKTTRIMELTNMNENIEQQLECQRQMIEDSKIKMANLESCYEQELEMCRRELLTLKCKSHVPIEMNEKINCLKERNQSLEYELADMQSQLDIQCRNFDKLKEDCDDQCCNLDKMSAQLFNKTDLIEQLTSENHRISSQLELSRQKVSQLMGRSDSLNRALMDKDHQLELDRKKDVVVDEGIQRELNRLNRIICEKDQCIIAKNELLAQYCKELELNYELIQQLQCERNYPNSVISTKEFCEMKAENEKLAEEVECLRQQLNGVIGTGRQSRDRLMSGVRPHSRDRLSRPNSGYRAYSDQDNDKSDLTYTSTKSVAWQRSIHTDDLPREHTGSRVGDLQKAIDEYNTLVTSMDLSDATRGAYLGRSRDNAPSRSSRSTADRHSKIDIGLQNPDQANVYVVDVDSMVNARSRAKVPIDVQKQRAPVNQAEFRDVIDLLKNCNVQIDYDETKETFEQYFYRMMQKYNELEQFYLASMKINLDDPQDPANYQTLERFGELYEKSHQKLIQHCQLLKLSLASNTTEPGVDVYSVNDQRLLSPDDLVNLIDIVSTQQLQLAALQLAHRNLQEIAPPIRDSKQRRSSPMLHLTEQYQGIWLKEDVCNPDIRAAALKVRQKSLVGTESRRKSIDPHIGVLRSKISSLESLNVKSSQRVPSSSKASVRSDSRRQSRLTATQNMVTPQESVKSSRSIKKRGSATSLIEPANSQLSNKRVSSLSAVKNDSKSINFGRPKDLNYPSAESVGRSRIWQLSETSISPSTVRGRDGPLKTKGPNFQQHFAEGVSMSEGKTQAIKDLEDSFRRASVSQFEKELHQLKNIDFDNFDSSISPKDRVRIYSAEIDYLNEKNLFHTYAISAIQAATAEANSGGQRTDQSKNSQFVNQLCDSLTNKAKLINQLQSEFQFDPHISKKEKELINKVLDRKNDFTFRKLFDSWVAPSSGTATRRELGKRDQSSMANMTNKINELTKKLELCQSQLKKGFDKPSSNDKLVETLQSEKKCLIGELEMCQKKVHSLQGTRVRGSSDDSVSNPMQEYRKTIERLTKENQNLKVLLKNSSDRVTVMTQQSGNEQSKHSKIPLLRGSSVEAPVSNTTKSTKWDDVNRRLLTDMTNVTKIIGHAADTLGMFRHTNNNTGDLTRASKDIISATGRMTQAITDVKQSGALGSGVGWMDGKKKSSAASRSDDKSLLQSNKLVSPDDVKQAIARETSIESLRQFALLLAEDNFDLAAEIEKLLVTIEELRRQLKENCEILSETVDMLQNSENFVNQLEKKLAIETKKTQVITSRIDKLNELNGKVILELERILKQAPSIQTADMSSQERYDYLFECLKKIEAENTKLLTKKAELEVIL